MTNDAADEPAVHRSGLFRRPSLPALMYLIPVVTARSLLKPIGVYPATGGAVDTVATVRSVLGTVVVLGTLLHFNPRAILTVPEQQLYAMTYGAVVGTAVVVLCLPLTLALVVPGQRLRAAGALSRPLLRMALLGLLGWGLAASRVVTFRDGGVWVFDGQSIGSGPVTWNSFALGMARNVVSIWLFLFVLAVIYYVAAEMFAVADAHPILAAVVPPAVAAVVLALTETGWVTRVIPLEPSSVQDVSHQRSTLFSVCGIVTLVAVSAWEAVRTNQLAPLRGDSWR